MTLKNTGVEIGLARPEELPDIWALFQRTFLDTYVDNKAGITRERLVDFLAADVVYLPKNWMRYVKSPNKTRTIYVARQNNEVVGIISPVLVNGRSRITALYVDPKLQHQGIGTKLMQKALSHHGNVDVYIGVASHVKELRQFYKRFGFKVLGPQERAPDSPDPISYTDMMRPASKA